MSRSWQRKANRDRRHTNKRGRSKSSIYWRDCWTKFQRVPRIGKLRDYVSLVLVLTKNDSWAQISKAMNGKRTPRQVASRVQKYYEKLKQFGLDIGGSNRMNGTWYFYAHDDDPKSRWIIKSFIRHDLFIACDITKHRLTLRHDSHRLLYCYLLTVLQTLTDSEYVLFLADSFNDWNVDAKRTVKLRKCHGFWTVPINVQPCI